MNNIVQIENKSGKVKLTDAVTPWSVEKLTEEIGKLFGATAAENGADFGPTMATGTAVDTLELEINSPGGSIFDGYNIYNEIKSLRERGVVVTATVTGMAASMASVICMSCDSIRMVPHGRMMIHEASSGVRGNADELRKQADLLDGISADIAAIYAERTGKTTEECRALMKVETWMNAKECVEMGFANEIFDIRHAEPTKASMSLLSKLFPGNDQVAQLEAQIAENDSLRADLTEAQAKINELTGLSAIIADKDTEITALATAKQDLETALSTAASDLASKDTAIEAIATQATADLAAKDAEIEAAKAGVSIATVQALASIGQPEAIVEADAPVAVDHMKVLNSLSGAEKRNYWKSHRSELRATI
tara:strand:+ start:116 stop:1213 length:1098 start_codon:yes stop_codon:yes gene_type:complete